MLNIKINTTENMKAPLKQRKATLHKYIKGKTNTNYNTE